MTFQTISGEKIARERYTGQHVENIHFIGCDFSNCLLNDTTFSHCRFYDEHSQTGTRFQWAQMKDASFSHCDLSMADFRNVSALGIELRECKLQGADFRAASFMNIITQRSFFCSAYITKCNLSYCNFSDIILEKCLLTENRWQGALLTGANFSGSDLSGGEFDQVDWQSANFTHCDLTQSALPGLDIRRVDLEGVTLENWQLIQLADQLGLLIISND